jgi:hypothetical protein
MANKDLCVYIYIFSRGYFRRTADVRSIGFSELIVLSRDDVLTALKDHPAAEVSCM